MDHLATHRAAGVEDLALRFGVSKMTIHRDLDDLEQAGLLRKLRGGGWVTQDQLDLHGLRVDQAREAVAAFIRDAMKRGFRCVRIIHGKGLGSPGKEPVLKSKVQRWLVQKNQVLAFVQAKPSDGGAGALVVLLGPSAG